MRQTQADRPVGIPKRAWVKLDNFCTQTGITKRRAVQQMIEAFLRTPKAKRLIKDGATG